MAMKAEKSEVKTICSRLLCLALQLIVGFFFVKLTAKAAAPTSTNPPTPSTPREFFNAGTKQLQEKKFREAEAFFETALASQKSDLQPLALYNLGHVRFDQGVEELKSSAGKPAGDRARTAEQGVSDAIKKADDALAGDDLQKLVAAYVHGKGMRKEARQAIEAIRRALDAHGAALRKWERASGDFKSALELNSNDIDSRQNAEIVDRYIARLIDSLQQLQKCNSGLCEKNSGLGQKLKQLKGRIPADQAPPGGAGDDDEEEDQMPLGSKPEQKEGPSKDGKEMFLTPEQAGWLLEGFKLDSERRLPMGFGPESQPRDRSRPTW
ncbi:MAG TPA: hypothetical protein VFA77_09600 [Candidatus Eisenbacteria bacterium]|nr:hypothetical protein [Candidatus Eisenbacteria bacterium]